ncbi:hypothetical protein EDC40_10361 [Aminobacter aminovorans]|uniref:Uncharacterized protein n=1 Tax=Aminobacter aminovorans TaxID=83263 RepID=A0A380WM68_AMIAI|nr:hypothetical protein [Aminobacter aminovorans]TCS27596.1 hypothetical protein EDC40_10361 [Aminobacter aminovorans]SUU89991.1 Uncharacterised protein [Aminobacter aminovorans]
MPKFIVTYDLPDSIPNSPDPHATFLEEARKLDWDYWILVNHVWYRLPNTTLIGQFSDIAAATASFHAIEAATTKALRRTVKADKFFVANYITSRLSSDEQEKEQ